MTARLRPRARRPLSLAASTVALGLALASAPAAHAADVPLRAIGFDEQGATATTFNPVAVSDDGREVIGNIAAPSLRPVVRNVAAGTTTRLGFDGDALDASDDLGVVLYRGAAVNGSGRTKMDYDYYVFDRATGRSTIVDRDASGNLGPAGGAGTETGIRNIELSGDGRFVTFHAQHAEGALISYPAPVLTDDEWRFDRASGTLTRRAVTTGATSTVYGRLVSADGRVVADDAGIDVAGRRIGYPAALAREPRLLVTVSPDGSAAVVRSDGAKAFSMVNTATGAATTFPVPQWMNGANYALDVWDVANGGGSFTLGTTSYPSDGARYTFYTLAPGAIATPVGGAIRLLSGYSPKVLAPNHAFAATEAHLAQLGSTPLPGTDQPQTTKPKATDYLDFNDVTCTNNIFFISWNRAYVKLASVPRGADLRIAKSASIIVYDTTTKQTINSFALNAGQGRTLTVPRTGGFSYGGVITFTDGSRLSGMQTVPVHPMPTCPLIL